MTAIPANLTLLSAADEAYSAACASWNARVQHRPDTIARPASASEVAAAVRHAVSHNQRVRVQATGHGACVPCEGGLLLRTGELRDVMVDPDTHTAVVSAGAQWRDVLPLAYAAGLAPVVGTTSDVGVIGFSLGGGVSWFARAYGPACDMVDAAQIVTADGNLRWVDADIEPDLFWAVRGGGPNFGVVTALRLRLTPHAELYAGSLVWPVERFDDVATAWRDWTADVPHEMTSTLAVLHAPEAPFVPEPMRGKSFVMVHACYAGSAEEGVRLAAPLREIGGLLMDDLGPMPSTRIDDIARDPVDPLPHLMWGSMLSTVDDASLTRLSEIAPRDAAPYVVLELRHIGGGVRPEPDRAGLAQWNGDFMLETISFAPTPEALSAGITLGDRLDDVLADVSTGLTPLNFVGTPDRVRRAWTPEHLARLREVKRAYDPDGIFGATARFPVDIGYISTVTSGA